MLLTFCLTLCYIQTHLKSFDDTECDHEFSRMTITLSVREIWVDLCIFRRSGREKNVQKKWILILSTLAIDEDNR